MEKIYGLKLFSRDMNGNGTPAGLNKYQKSVCITGLVGQLYGVFAPCVSCLLRSFSCCWSA